MSRFVLQKKEGIKLGTSLGAKSSNQSMRSVSLSPEEPKKTSEFEARLRETLNKEKQDKTVVAQT